MVICELYDAISRKVALQKSGLSDQGSILHGYRNISRLSVKGGEEGFAFVRPGVLSSCKSKCSPNFRHKKVAEEASSAEQGQEWSLRLDANPLSREGSCPSPLHCLRREDKVFNEAFIRDIANSYWRHLLQNLHGKVEENKGLRFSLLERLYFDWGIWCGEQFENAPEVRELLDERGDVPKKKMFQAVFEELAESFSHEIKSGQKITGITGWISQRDESYRIMGEAERFSVSEEFLPMVPEECAEYFSLKSGRLEVLNRMKGMLDRLPGASTGLTTLVMSGALHDELDFLESKRFLDPESTRRKAKLSGLWNGVRDNLKKLFPEESGPALGELVAVSGKIVQFCKTRQMDVEKIRELARKAYKGEQQTFKRLSRDIQLLRNNLSLGCMRKNKKAHLPMPLVWPEAMDLDRLSAFLSRVEELDFHFPQNSSFLLTAGDFDGFFEFDRETLILPLYARGREQEQCVSALGDYRFSIETLRGNSGLIEDLKRAFPQRPPKEAFLDLYRRWIESGSSGNPGLLGAADLELIMNHVAPSPRTLFLRHAEFELEQTAKNRILELIKAGKATPKQMHIMAGQCYKEEKYDEAVEWLKRSVQAEANNPAFEISIAVILARMKNFSTALKVLRKWQDREDCGFHCFFVQKLASAMSGAGN